MAIFEAVVAAGVLLLVMAPATAESPAPGTGVSLALEPGGSLEIDGDSSLHRYSAKAHGMEVGLDVDAPRGSEAAPLLDLEALVRGHFIRKFELSVPVDKLSSGEGGLDTNMRKALKGDQYKRIRFQMDSYDVLAPTASGAVFALVLHGRLSLAGVERRIDVGADGAKVAAGIRISGKKDLLMTDYKIKPPTVMFGTIKTANLITVKFNATLRKAGTP